MLGIVGFPLFASLRIFFIFRKKVNIRKYDFPPKRNRGKKLSVGIYHLLTLKPQVSFWKVYSCTKKKHCWWLKMFGMWTLLPYRMSSFCSSVSPFVKQPGCATLLTCQQGQEPQESVLFSIVTGKRACLQSAKILLMYNRKKSSCILSYFLCPRCNDTQEPNNQNKLGFFLWPSPGCIFFRTHFWLYGVSRSKSWVHSQSLAFRHVKQMLKFQTDVLYVIDNDW